MTATHDNAVREWTARADRNDGEGSSFDWFAEDDGKSSTVAAGALRHACVFELGGTTYGLDVAAVSEVFTPDLITPVPLAPAGFIGLCNLRGAALAIADFASVLVLSIPADIGRTDGTRPVLVLRFGEMSVGVTIDRVVEIRSYREGEVTPAQGGGTDDLLHGFLRRDSNAQSGLISMLRSEFLRARLEGLRLRRDFASPSD